MPWDQKSYLLFYPNMKHSIGYVIETHVFFYRINRFMKNNWTNHIESLHLEVRVLYNKIQVNWLLNTKGMFLCLIGYVLLGKVKKQNFLKLFKLKPKKSNSVLWFNKWEWHINRTIESNFGQFYASKTTILGSYLPIKMQFISHNVCFER